MVSHRWFMLGLSFAVFGSLHAQSSDPSHAPADHPWWRPAVIYEVYPRSFADSNNDGIGDLNGIASKLDYLEALGVDAIWITPCYPSPQKDFGYDVSDYTNIDPMYGTLADFDHLVEQARKHHIRVLMDFVLNHTSDQNPWFLDSRSSRTSVHRDWYIWRDGKGPGEPPNNWISDFGGSAWTWDAKTGQYYYHYFEAAQPDLNWRNPLVEKAMFNVARFWYDRGVAGFRLDAVDTLFEDPKLHDNPYVNGEMVNKYNDNLPENHVVLRRLRRISDGYDAVLLGETWTDNIGQLKQYYGDHDDEIQLPMNFMFATVNTLSAPKFRHQIDSIESSGEWPVFVITNHDMERSYNRYGDGVHNDEIAKLMAALYLTLRGTAVMYYGEEIGMSNNDPTRLQDVLDPLGRMDWPKNKGRDGERTPMQWSAAPNAGFTAGKPWLPIPASYKTHNVATELADPDSILNFYKTLLHLRRDNPVLASGDYIDVDPDNPNLLCFLRSYQGRSVLIALNLSGQPQPLSLDLARYGWGAGKASVLLSTMQQPPTDPGNATLDPFAVVIIQSERVPTSSASGSVVASAHVQN
ncbi:MAG TPA: alpha-glucosidase [Acidobacteriaceae bacterium]|jgi:alpha-glucosidase|nr:alpha-glucosidase [Acidobacteriaceae bacterium]